MSQQFLNITRRLEGETGLTCCVKDIQVYRGALLLKSSHMSEEKILRNKKIFLQFCKMS